MEENTTIDRGSHSLSYYRFFGYPSVLECATEILRSNKKFQGMSERLNTSTTKFSNQNEIIISLNKSKSTDDSNLHVISDENHQTTFIDPSGIPSILSDKLSNNIVIQTVKPNTKKLLPNHESNHLLEKKVGSMIKQMIICIRGKSEQRKIRYFLYIEGEYTGEGSFNNFAKITGNALQQYNQTLNLNEYHKQLETSGFSTIFQNLDIVKHKDINFINLNVFRKNFENRIWISVIDNPEAKSVLLDVMKVAMITIYTNASVTIKVQDSYYKTLSKFNNKNQKNGKV